MRAADYLDSLYRFYLSALDSGGLLPSAQFGLTGYVSSCCGSYTYEGPKGLTCAKCRSRCDTRSWRAARREGTCGGWDPRRARGQANQIAVSETPSRRTDSTDARLALHADRIGQLPRLFARPRDWSSREWVRALLVWKWLVERDVWRLVNIDYVGYPGCAKLAGLRGETWTEEEIRTWIAEARKVVARRVERLSDRRLPMPKPASLRRAA